MGRRKGLDGNLLGGIEEGRPRRLVAGSKRLDFGQQWRREAEMNGQVGEAASPINGERIGTAPGAARGGGQGGQSGARARPGDGASGTVGGGARPAGGGSGTVGGGERAAARPFHRAGDQTSAARRRGLRSGQDLRQCDRGQVGVHHQVPGGQERPAARTQPWCFSFYRLWHRLPVPHLQCTRPTGRSREHCDGRIACGRPRSPHAPSATAGPERVRTSTSGPRARPGRRASGRSREITVGPGAGSPGSPASTCPSGTARCIPWSARDLPAATPASCRNGGPPARR